MASNTPPIIIKTDDGTEAMRVDPTGKVGIGTTTPSNPLEVNGNSGIRQNRLYMSGGDGWSSLTYNAHHNDANNNWVFPDPSHEAVTIEMDDASGTPRFQVWSTTPGNPTGWVQRFAIDGNSGNVLMGQSGGNVGIGTTSPNNQLALTSQASFGGNTSNTGSEPIEVQGSGAGVSFYDRSGGATGRWVIYSERTGGAGTETLRFWSAGDKVTITQGGDVGISGSASVGGDVGISGGASVGMGVGITGPATIHGPVDITGATTINGGTMINGGVYIAGGVDIAGGVYIAGDLMVSGNKSFVQDHPTDPTRQIVYVSLEGGESGTYTRGTWRLEDGKAVIELPEHFGMVTSEDGLSAQLTPRGEWLQLYVVQLTTREVVVQEAQGKSGQFDYLIQGVRKGYEHHEVIREKK